MVRRKIEQWNIFELRSPKCEFLQHDRPLRLFALPDRVVPILDGELGEGGLEATGGRIVESAKLVRNQAHRPVINYRVMRRHQQHMFGVFDTQQVYAKQGTRRQIKSPSRFLEGKPVSLG